MLRSLLPRLLLLSLLVWTPLLGAGCGGGRSPEDEKKLKLQAFENLKQIGAAMQSYHETNLVLPTMFKGAHMVKPGQSDKALLSWRVELLPYLNQAKLYDQFKRDEPWDSPHNKKLLDQMPAVYRDPRFQDEEKPTATYFQGFTGTGGVLGVPGGITLPSITNANGTTFTFLVVEAGDPVPWTKPDDLVHDPKKPLPPLGGPKRTDFLALFCDGHVQTVPARTDEQTLRCYIQWDNRTPVKLP